MRSLAVVGSVLLGMLNVTVITGYVLWAQANDWAAARSEAGQGFDPGMLLPHGALFWLASNSTLVLLVLIDAVWICLAIFFLRRPASLSDPVPARHSSLALDASSAPAVLPTFDARPAPDALPAPAALPATDAPPTSDALPTLAAPPTPDQPQPTP